MTAKSAQSTKKYDFDNWDEEKEAAAIEEIAANQTNFRYLISGNSLVVELPSKDIAEFPLDITTDDIERAMENESATEAELFLNLIRQLELKEASTNLKGTNLILLSKIAMLYFETIGKITGVALGE